MTPFVRVSLAALLAGVAFAQPGGTWFEQWHKAKFGQPTPAQQAQARADSANSAWRQAPTAVDPAAARQWANEQRFMSKYGRHTPSEEARQNAAMGNSAFRAAPSGPLENTWSRDYMKANLGR